MWKWYLSKIGYKQKSYSWQWPTQFTTPLMMGLPPPTRWSIQIPKGQYRDHLVGQLTSTILDSTNQAGLTQPSWDQPIFFSTYLGEISGARSELVVFRFTEPFCLSCILNDIPWQPFFSKYQYCSQMTKERWRTRTLWILKGNLCQLQKFAQLIHCWCICFIQSNIVQMQHKYTMYVVQI